MKFAFPDIYDPNMFLKTNLFIKEYLKYKNSTPEAEGIEIYEILYEQELFDNIYKTLESMIYKKEIKYTLHKTDFKNVICLKVKSPIFPVQDFFVGLIEEKALKSKTKEILTQLTLIIIESQISVKGSFIEEVLKTELKEEDKDKFFFIESTDYFYED